jgi:hypothetical protein
MGMSRDTFYRYKSAAEDGGVEALFKRTRRKPNLANRMDQTTEDAVTKPGHSMSWASWASLSHPQACGQSGCGIIWQTSKIA